MKPAAFMTIEDDQDTSVCCPFNNETDLCSGPTCALAICADGMYLCAFEYIAYLMSCKLSENTCMVRDIGDAR